MGKERPAFYDFLGSVIEGKDYDQVTMDDAERLLEETKERIKRLHEARKGFIREDMSLDSKGRTVIPKKFRTRLSWDENTPLEGLLDESQGVLIRKAY